MTPGSKRAYSNAASPTSSMHGRMTNDKLSTSSSPLSDPEVRPCLPPPAPRGTYRCPRCRISSTLWAIPTFGTCLTTRPRHQRTSPISRSRLLLGRRAASPRCRPSPTLASARRRPLISTAASPSGASSPPSLPSLPGLRASPASRASTPAASSPFCLAPTSSSRSRRPRPTACPMGGQACRRTTCWTATPRSCPS
jgi:hypothetical protein